MKIFKLIFTIAVFGVLLYTNPLEVSAQGYFNCVYIDQGGGSGTCSLPSTNNCDLNCYPNPNFSCSTFNNTSAGTCQTARSCVCNTWPGSQQLDLQQLYNIIQSPSRPAMFRFSQGASLGSIITSSILILFPIAGLILLLYLIYGGYNMMLSGGDPKKAATAKSILTTALLGFTIIFLSYWIVKIIGSVLGLTDFSTIF